MFRREKTSRRPTRTVLATAYTFVALGTLAVLSPVQAQYSVLDPNAFGQTDGVLGCLLTEEGLKVSFVQNKPTMVGGLSAVAGQSCLPIIAQYPGPFPTPLYIAQLAEAAQGGDSSVAIRGFGTFSIKNRKARVGAVVACALDDTGIFRTALVDSGEVPLYTPSNNELCMDTLAVLDGQGMRAGRMVAASLDGAGSGGGLLWVLRKPGFVAVVQCNLKRNDSGPDDFLTRSVEDSANGLDENVPPGEHCVDTLARLQDQELQIVGEPIPVPKKKAGTDTSDPGCLIWDIDGGVILQ